MLLHKSYIYRNDMDKEKCNLVRTTRNVIECTVCIAHTKNWKKCFMLVIMVNLNKYSVKMKKRMEKLRITFVDAVLKFISV